MNSLRRLEAGAAEVLVLADEDAVSRAGADRTVAALRDTLAAGETAHLALTGGSSAVSLYRHMSGQPWQSAIDWRQVHMWWGDDRFVPRDHPESNAGLAYRTLFAVAAFSAESGSGADGIDVETGVLPGLVIDPEKVHPIPTEEALAHSQGPEWAARAYADEISRFVPATVGSALPGFDVILLGIGPDGHTMSVFPGSPTLRDSTPSDSTLNDSPEIAMATSAPEHVEPHLPRVTLTPQLLGAARSVVVLAAGEGKAEIMGKILGPDRDASRWPAQAALLPNAVWLLDEAAAASL